MADPHTISVPRQTDRNIVDRFLGIAESQQITSIKINTGAGGQFELSTSDSFPEQVAALLDENLSVIESASIPVPGFTIRFHRGGRGKSVQERSPYYDDISFSYSQQNCKISEADRLYLITRIAKELQPVDPNRVVGGLSEEQQQLLAVHSSTLGRLEGLNEKLIKDSEEFRHRLEEKYQERADELETKHHERADQLEEEYGQKAKELEEREEEVRRKLKEIDDRQNTHVRRELRKSILEEIRDRSQDMRLTQSTSRLRLPVHFVCIVLMGLLGGGAIFYAVELSAIVRAEEVGGNALFAVLAKQLFVSVAFGATSVFYLRWLNSWFSKHADNEFRLRQLQLDVERASWVVETAFEWKDAKGMSIPHELLEPISKGLFHSDDNGSEELHPADQLASALLGTASSVRLRVGDSEVTLDGKKLAKLKNEE